MCERVLAYVLSPRTQYEKRIRRKIMECVHVRAHRAAAQPLLAGQQCTRSKAGGQRSPHCSTF